MSEHVKNKELIDWDDISNKIWMNDGKIVVCTTFKNATPRLFSCIEDNIVEIDGLEYIEWRHVEKDYKSTRTEKQ